MMKHVPHTVAALPSESTNSPRSGVGLGDHNPIRGAALKTLIGLIVLFAISGCGFQPVHGTQTRAEYASQIESVEIVTDNTRSGQLLKAEIQDLANPTAQRSEKLFVLKITVTETEMSLFINPDGTSGRGDYQFTSNYVLSRKFDGKVIDMGTLTRSSSYNNALTADFSTFVSREAAKRRGIVELAQDYKLRLGNLVPKINDPNAKPSGAGILKKPPVTRPLDPSSTQPSAFDSTLEPTDETGRQGY